LTTSRPEGWIRLSILAEKRILLEQQEKYDGLVIPAHVFALYRNSISPLLRTLKKPFFIDPMSYVFLEPRETVSRADGRTKRSYVKLVELCPQGNTLLENNPPNFAELSSEDSENIIETIVNIAVKSQLPENVIRPGEDSLRRIRRALGTENGSSLTPNPNFLVTPYYFIDSIGEENYNYTSWLQSIERFEEKVQRLRTGLPVYRSLLLRASIFEDMHSLSRLMHDIGDPPGLVIWVEDFEKCGPSDSCIDGFRDFVGSMKDRGVKKILSLYGGYFTAAFHKYGLDGICFGVSSGDSKKVETSASGGGAPSRYYSPSLHSFQTAEKMLRFLSTSIQHASLFSCNCPVCNSTLQEIRKSATTNEVRDALNSLFRVRGSSIALDWFDERKHFLYTRANELENIGRCSLQDLADEARHTIQGFKELGGNDLDFHTLDLLVKLSERPS
jgi:hypothetical protein